MQATGLGVAALGNADGSSGAEDQATLMDFRRRHRADAAHWLASEPGGLWKCYLVTSSLFVMGAVVAVPYFGGFRQPFTGRPCREPPESK